jgi:rhodanese-related sulfurtransferase
MAIPEVDVDTLEAKLAEGARLIDVRQPDEFADGHIPGAVLVPLADVPDRLEAFSPTETNYLVCRSGARSMRAAEYLADRGFDVVNVIGGTLAWQNSGRATDTETAS